MAEGMFIRRGPRWESTFEPTVQGFKSLVRHAYQTNFAELNPLMRAAGTAGYNLPNADGMFNEIYGFKVSAAMFGSKAVSGAIQKRAYDHQGMRILPGYATYGLAKDFYYNGEKMFKTDEGTEAQEALDNTYVGLGAGTVHEGIIPDSIMMPYDEINVPYKELTFAWDYGLALQMLEGKDDTTKRDYYAKTMGENFDDQIDIALCRSLLPKMPTRTNYKNALEETSLTGLARLISSGLEVGLDEGNGTIDIEATLPWGGWNSDLKNYRFKDEELVGCSGTSTALAVAHTENQYDCQLVNADGQPLSLDHLEELYMKTKANWGNEGTEGKFWLMSPLAWSRASKLAKAQHVDTSKVYTKISVGGTSTCEGTDFGYLLSSYDNIPIMESGHLSFNYQTGRIDFAKYNNVMMVDSNHVFMRTLSPVQLYAYENIAISRDLREHNAAVARSEAAIDKWITSGKIVALDKQ